MNKTYYLHLQNTISKYQIILLRGSLSQRHLRYITGKKEDLNPIQNFLQILEAEHNIEPLCQFIEENLLKPLKDNSVKHSNEEALKQAFMDTLILTLHMNIQPEFQV